MAKDTRGTGTNRNGGGTHRMNYEMMSRDELVEHLGGDIDASLSREDLVQMAIERDRASDTM
jgi:hypothetical protein